MFTAKKYRAKSKEYGDLIKGSNDPGQIRELQDSKDSFSSLADNEELLAKKFDKMVQVPAAELPSHVTLADEEERVLRSGTRCRQSFSASLSTRPDRWANS